MRRPLSFVLLSIPLCIGIACSSSDDDSGKTSGAYEPAGNGVPTSESAACNGLQNAETARWNALGCGPRTNPACPGYLQKQKGTPNCSQYDQGALQACIAYVAQLASCDDIAKKTCIVKPIPNTAPNGCAVVDSGADAGQDAGEDAGEDAAEDSGEDAGQDVVVEDVAADVDDGSAVDAASE